jgi:hypothetical protein
MFGKSLLRQFAENSIAGANFSRYRRPRVRHRSEAMTLPNLGLDASPMFSHRTLRFSVEAPSTRDSKVASVAGCRSLFDPTS